MREALRTKPPPSMDAKPPTCGPSHCREQMRVYSAIGVASSVEASESDRGGEMNALLRIACHGDLPFSG